MFPRVKKISNERINEVKVEYYDKTQALEIDKTKCIGCGLCIKACPKSVIYSKSLEGKVRVPIEDLIPEIPNPLDCSYCGTCAFVCPTFAIYLKKNGRYVNRKDIGIIAKNVVPQLNFDCVDLTNPEAKAKMFIDGKVEIDEDKCISCMSCLKICPTNSFSKADTDKKRTKPIFHDDKCIKCGACVRACSKNAIKFEINDIKYSGKFNDYFWNSLIERIRSAKVV